MTLSIITRITMAIIYLGCGMFLLIGNNIFDFADFQKYGLGVLLLVYGIYRLFIALKEIKESKYEEK